MHGFDALAPWRVDYFRRLVALLDERQVPTGCAVTPLHGALDRYLTDTTAYAARLDDLISLLESVESARLSWLDARTVDRFGGDPDDFENAAHIGRWNAERLTTAMLERLATLPTMAPRT